LKSHPFRVEALVLAATVLSFGWARSANAEWRQSAFVIGGFGGGSDPIGLQRLDRAGIEFVIPFESAAPWSARRVVARLDSLRASVQGFRLKAFVYEETDSPSTLFKNSDPVSNRAAILRELAPAQDLNTASVAGWYIWDEPPVYYPPSRKLSTERAFASVHEMTKIIRDSTNGASTSSKLALVTLLPIHAASWFGATCGTDTTGGYACYLDAYLSSFAHDSLPAPVVMFDNYPFETREAPFRLYFQQLAAVRDAAAKYSRPDYSIPVWSVIQASPRKATPGAGFQSTPTFNQIRWQAYVSLAYGAKGIFYWTLRPDDRAGYGESYLRRDGSANGALLDSLTALNAEIRSLGPTLMKLEAIGAVHSSANAYLIPARDDSVLASVRSLRFAAATTGRIGDGVIGIFSMPGTPDRYMLVVNKNVDIPASFSVLLGAPASAVERISKSTGKPLSLATQATQFDTGMIAPGGGELFKISPSTPR
jgi:hypothetical protein